ncbi:MAG TPA: SRPBCC family protein [Actinomycetota bacterium]|nr:SRPBCC family protein [Actinomycetota bacterium]
MAVTDTDVVVQEILISASPETIFEFFTDPEKMTRWKGRKADLDPRPGGIYKVDMSGTNVALGEFVELVPHERIVFTWGWEGHPTVQPGSSTVEITFTPDGDKTRVRLVHRDLPEDEREQHNAGWSHFLPRLVSIAEGNDPGTDPWFTDQP